MKMNRKGLVSLVLAVALVMTMMTSGTIAWFTDEVTSANNEIQAGNLDVELLHYTSENIVEPVKETTELFKLPTLWEPGAMAYEKLVVKNVGNLALKYRLSMNASNENTVKDTEYKLSDVVKFAVLTDVPSLLNRENVMAALQGKDMISLHDFAHNGDLKGGTDDADQFLVVAYWAPGAEDNNYNLNNGKTSSNGRPLSIELGVKLVATQLTHEGDSFDNLYDEGAAKTVKPEEFKDAIMGLKSGDVLRLEAGVYEWTGTLDMMIRADNVKIQGAGPGTVLKLNNAAFVYSDNVTISDLTIDNASADGNHAALKVTYENEKHAVKNFTIRNVVLKSAKSHGLNLHYVEGAIVDNVSVEAYGKCGFSLAESTGVKFTNCKTVAGNGWGFDIGCMEADKATSFEFDASNVFANGIIYSEGNADSVTYPVNYWNKTDGSNGNWALTRTDYGKISTKDQLTAQLGNAKAGDVLELTADVEITEAYAIPAGVKLVSTNGSTITTTQKITLGENAAVDGLKLKTADNLDINILYLNTGASVTNCDFSGFYHDGENEVSRGIEIAPGAQNFVIANNTFDALRQPAYINNGSTGTVSGNTVTSTRGFVVCSDSDVTFINNSFSNNAVDICIIASNTSLDNYAGKAAQMSEANNGAYVQNQVTSEEAGKP